MRFIGKLLAAIIFSVISLIAASPLAAAFVTDNGASSPSNFVFLAVFVGVIVIVLFAPTVRRAFGRGFLLSGVLFLLLPLSTMLLSGTVASEMMTASAASGASEGDQAATALGATLGAGLMTGLAAFVGLILGAVFVILGLVLALGGRREVIVVQTRG